jgi:hypothetical protein
MTEALVQFVRTVRKGDHSVYSFFFLSLDIRFSTITLLLFFVLFFLFCVLKLGWMHMFVYVRYRKQANINEHPHFKGSHMMVMSTWCLQRGHIVQIKLNSTEWFILYFSYRSLIAKKIIINGSTHNSKKWS